MKRALLPDPAARAALEAECRADLVMHVAASGAAMPITIPKFRDHIEEVAWWHGQHEKEQGR